MIKKLVSRCGLKSVDKVSAMFVQTKEAEILSTTYGSVVLSLQEQRLTLCIYKGYTVSENTL